MGVYLSHSDNSLFVLIVFGQTKISSTVLRLYGCFNEGNDERYGVKCQHLVVNCLVYDCSQLAPRPGFIHPVILLLCTATNKN